MYSIILRNLIFYIVKLVIDRDSIKIKERGISMIDRDTYRFIYYKRISFSVDTNNFRFRSVRPIVRRKNILVEFYRCTIDCSRVGRKAVCR